jgi:hypothetical protein
MHTRLARLVVLMLTALVPVACGKNSSTPTSPTPSTSGPTRVIGLSGSLAFGEVAVGGQRDLTFTISNTGTQALTVTGMTVTGGLSAHTTATWTNGTIASGASQPVTVRFAPTTAGSYTGTLTVNGDQTSGTNTLPISGTATAPSFQGTWAGRYVIDRCDGTGSIQDLLCSSNRGHFPPGTSLPISMTFTQNGNAVSGTFAFGQVTGVGNGVVGPDGVLTLQGTATASTISASIASWNTRIENGQMVGSVTYNFSERTTPGVATVVARLSGVTRR